MHKIPKKISFLLYSNNLCPCDCEWRGRPGTARRSEHQIGAIHCQQRKEQVKRTETPKSAKKTENF